MMTNPKIRITGVHAASMAAACELKVVYETEVREAAEEDHGLLAVAPRRLGSRRPGWKYGGRLRPVQRNLIRSRVRLLRRPVVPSALMASTGAMPHRWTYSLLQSRAGVYLPVMVSSKG